MTAGSAIRVLEIASPATAAAGRLLADAGASVVKVEPPATSPATQPLSGEHLARRRYHDTDKRGLSLAIDTAAGRDLLGRLIPAFDIVVEAGPPGHLAEIGFPYEVLARANPGLTLVSITPFGQSGPYAPFKADDFIAFAMGGLMFLSGRPDLPPVVAPCEQAFMTAAVHAATGALAAHWAATRTGHGEWVDVSIMECLVAQENTITNFRGGEDFSRRMGSQHRTAIPGRIFACRDGYAHIFILHQDPQVWQRFLDWMGRPAEIAGPEFVDVGYRSQHAEAVTAATERFAASQTREELFTSGQALHLPITPVYTVGEVLADPHVRYLDVLQPVPGDRWDPYFTLRPALRRGGRVVPRSQAPLPGSDTDAVLRDLLGMTAAECAALRSVGVV